VTHLPPTERRGSGRPSNGDTAPCPRCAVGTIEFSERYRVVYAGQGKAVPAWVCDVKACGYFLLARRGDRAVMLRRLGAARMTRMSSPRRHTASRPATRKKPH
jgi:hypothetical protein